MKLAAAEKAAAFSLSNGLELRSIGEFCGSSFALMSQHSRIWTYSQYSSLVPKLRVQNGRFVSYATTGLFPRVIMPRRMV
jgi:hypothetical protein